MNFISLSLPGTPWSLSQYYMKSQTVTIVLLSLFFVTVTVLALPFGSQSPDSLGPNHSRFFKVPNSVTSGVLTVWFGPQGGEIRIPQGCLGSPHKIISSPGCGKGCVFWILLGWMSRFKEMYFINTVSLISWIYSSILNQQMSGISSSLHCISSLHSCLNQTSKLLEPLFRPQLWWWSRWVLAKKKTQKKTQKNKNKNKIKHRKLLLRERCQPERF